MADQEPTRLERIKRWAANHWLLSLVGACLLALGLVLPVVNGIVTLAKSWPNGAERGAEPVPKPAAPYSTPPTSAPASSVSASPVLGVRPADERCTDAPPLRVCAESLAYTGQRLRDDIVITAQMSVAITNVGAAPLRVFTKRVAGSLVPDAGPMVAENIRPSGIAGCDDLAWVCLRKPGFSPTLLQPGARVRLSLAMTQRYSAATAMQLARATRATLSYAIGAIDDTRAESELPVSAVFARLTVGGLQ